MAAIAMDLTGSATTSEPMVIVYVDDVSYSSNLPDLKEIGIDPDPEAILEARAANHRRSVEGTRSLQACHQQMPATWSAMGAARPRLPTLRKTATATRNFRRA